jgi:hypothetical protein
VSNHTTHDPGNIFLFRPPNPTIPSFIIVGNGSILIVTSVGDTVLPRPFYLNNVLDTPNIIKNLLSIHQFTTDNWYSMEFDPFGRSVKDLATWNVITRCNSLGPLYTIYLPTTRAPQMSTYYALIDAGAPISLSHHHLSHPGPVALLKLSTSSMVICNKPRHVPVCHACRLGRHTRLSFHRPSSNATQCFHFIHCDLWTSHIISILGSKYYLIILDDFLHYSDFSFVSKV